MVRSVNRKYERKKRLSKIWTLRRRTAETPRLSPFSRRDTSRSQKVRGFGWLAMRDNLPYLHDRYFTIRPIVRSYCIATTLFCEQDVLWHRKNRILVPVRFACDVPRRSRLPLHPVRWTTYLSVHSSVANNYEETQYNIQQARTCGRTWIRTIPYVVGGVPSPAS